jgi:predicted alpha/beta hydrolase family esterase
MASALNVWTVPGLGGSGPDHWQSRWESEHGYVRVEQRDWDHPDRAVWVAELERALARRSGPCLLVAHSLGCALVAHFVSAAGPAVSRVCGALLVSPADVEDPSCTPEVTRCFSPMPLERLPFPAIVIASANDPFVALARAQLFAQRWGAAFEDVGDLGHINAESQLGSWDEGQRILAQLTRRM